MHLRALALGCCVLRGQSAPSCHHGGGRPGKRPSGPVPSVSCLLRQPEVAIAPGHTHVAARAASAVGRGRGEDSRVPSRTSAWLQARPGRPLVDRWPQVAEDQRGTRDSSCASAPVTAALSRTYGAEGTCGVNTRDPARPTGHGRPATRAREQLSQCAVGSASGSALGSAADPALQPPRSPAMYAEMRRRLSAHFFSKLRRTGVKISPSSARPKSPEGALRGSLEHLAGHAHSTDTRSAGGSPRLRPAMPAPCGTCAGRPPCTRTQVKVRARR